MKVLLVADFYPPDPGGLESHVQRLAGALVRRGHEVTVVAGGRSAATDDSEPWPVVRASSSVASMPFLSADPRRVFHPPASDPRFRRVIDDVVRSFRPDVVHAHGWCAFSVASSARRSATPVVVTLHDYGLLCPKRTLRCGDRVCETGHGHQCVTCPSTEQGTLKRTGLAATLALTAPRLVASGVRFLAVSSYVAQRHLDAGVPSAMLDVVPNFIDPDVFVVTEAASPASCRDILFVGPADPYKGRPVLESAATQLEHPCARLVLVGDDAPMRATPEIPVVQPGRLVGEPLARTFGAAAVVVVPSTWPEPCPTVALEAMAYGRPVVASAIGGLPDIVTTETGMLVPPGHPEALSSALRALLEAPDRRAQMGEAGRERLRSRFSTAAVVPQIEDAYLRAVRG